MNSVTMTNPTTPKRKETNAPFSGGDTPGTCNKESALLDDSLGNDFKCSYVDPVGGGRVVLLPGPGSAFPLICYPDDLE